MINPTNALLKIALQVHRRTLVIFWLNQPPAFKKEFVDWFEVVADIDTNSWK